RAVVQLHRHDAGRPDVWRSRHGRVHEGEVDGEEARVKTRLAGLPACRRSFGVPMKKTNRRKFLQKGAAVAAAAVSGTALEAQAQKAAPAAAAGPGGPA